VTLMIDVPRLRDPLQSLVYGAVLAMVIGWVLHIGKDVLLPIVFSVLVAYVIVGTTRLVARIPGIGHRLPTSLQYSVALMVIATALWFTFWLVVGNLGRALELAPVYQESLLSTIQNVATWFGVESPTWATVRGSVMAQVSPQTLVASALALVTSTASVLVLGVLYVAFLLIEMSTAERKLTMLSSNPKVTAQVQKIVGHINDRIGTYLALKTFVCLVTGVATWMVMYAMGLELAVFFGVLVALMNYIPYLGSALGVILPGALGLLQFGPSSELLLLLGLLLALQFVLGNIVDPYLMANSLNLSPLTIVASLAGWAALWGLPGAFLAVPLTACIVMVLAEFDGTRPIAVLLSKTGRLGDEVDSRQVVVSSSGHQRTS
jgi:predicted PurR-regulated permease PerM